VITAQRSEAPAIAPPVAASPPPPVPQPEVTTPPPPPQPAPPPPPQRPAQPPAPGAKPPPEAQNYADLSAYVAARRRARGEPEQGDPADADVTRRNRIIAANLASLDTPTGAERRNSGGMFQITHLSSDAAEFTFFGWNKSIKRHGTQRIDVRREDHPDIRIAVVRRMIAIIREYEQEDFTWRSNRLGRDVTLSARLSDTEGLEQFMLREFF
jgi:hypothetical protein